MSETSTKQARPNFALRLVEWFWRGKALRATRADVARPLLVEEELLRRARLAAEVGRRSIEPSTPLEAGAADAPAFELYRHAIHFALAATNAGLDDRRKAAHGTLAELFAGADRALLLRGAGDEASLRELESALTTQSFADLPDLTALEQKALAERARRLAETLLDAAAEPRRRIEDLLFQRTWRMATLSLVVLGLFFGGRFVARSLRTDLALNKPWRASSMGSGGCNSPIQDCGSAYFFHTASERNPWVEIDLGKRQRFSSVRVTNRLDCCRERAIPLIVEVSDDGRRYREVARRMEDFQEWTADFPKVSARYVRVRLDATSILHLNRVSVLR